MTRHCRQKVESPKTLEQEGPESQRLRPVEWIGSEAGARVGRCETHRQGPLGSDEAGTQEVWVVVYTASLHS